MRCPLCHESCEASVELFTHHFSSRHDLTVSAHVFAANMLKSPRDFQETLLILKDFMTRKKLERDLINHSSDREKELANILRILQSRDTPMDYYPLEDSN